MNDTGFAQIDRAVIAMIPEIGVTTFAVYAVLAGHADDSRSCYPSETTIAAITGATTRTVRRAVARLREAGLIEATPGRGTLTTRYTLPPTVHRTTVSGRTPVSGGGGHQCPVRADTSVRQNETQRTRPKERARSKSKKAYPPDFEQWWGTYPRKEAKRKAFDAWLKAVESIIEAKSCERAAAILALQEATEEFAASPKGRAGRFCPHPTTWLNGERWEDDRAAWQEGNNGDGHAPPKREPFIFSASGGSTQ